MESSRQDLLNDMAVHRPILKNEQNTYHSCFGFSPKTGIAFPKTDFFFIFTVFSLATNKPQEADNAVF